MMNSRLHGIIVALTIAIIAIIIVGGSVTAALMGRDIPKWMEDAVILIIAAAFGASGFFAQMVQMDRQADTLGHVIERNHELAMAGTTMGPAAVAQAIDHAATDNAGAAR